MSHRQADDCAAAGTAHSAWWELGAWSEAVSGIESDQGEVGSEPPAPVSSGGGLEGCRGRVCLSTPLNGFNTFKPSYLFCLVFFFILIFFIHFSLIFF